MLLLCSEAWRRALILFPPSRGALRPISDAPITQQLERVCCRRASVCLPIPEIRFVAAAGGWGLRLAFFAPPPIPHNQLARMPFTPLPSLLGGVLLSVSTSSLLVDYGRVLGVSGIAHSVVSDSVYDCISSPSKPALDTGRPWNVACFAGLLAGGVLLRLGEGRIVRFVGAGVFDAPSDEGSVWRTVVAGLLVGFGTKVSMPPPPYARTFAVD